MRRLLGKALNIGASLTKNPDQWPVFVEQTGLHTHEFRTKNYEFIGQVHSNLNSEFLSALRAPGTANRNNFTVLLPSGELSSKELLDFQSRLRTLAYASVFDSKAEVPMHPSRDLVNATLHGLPILHFLVSETLSFPIDEIETRADLKSTHRLNMTYEFIAEHLEVPVESVLLELIDPYQRAVSKLFGVDVEVNNAGVDCCLCGSVKNLREAGKIAPVGYLPPKDDTDPAIEPVEVDTFVDLSNIDDWWTRGRA